MQQMYIVPAVAMQQMLPPQACIIPCSRAAINKVDAAHAVKEHASHLAAGVAGEQVQALGPFRTGSPQHGCLLLRQVSFLGMLRS